MTGFYKILFFISDLILLNLSILIAFYFFDSSLWENDLTGMVYLFIYSNLSWLFLVMVSAPYSLTKNWSVSKIIKNQVSFIFIHLLVVASLVVFFDRDYSLFQIILIYAVFTPLFFSFKIGIYFIRKIFIQDLSYRNYLIIGRNELASEVRKFYLLNPQIGYKFKGYIDFEGSDFSFEYVREFCSDKEVHEIYCCAPNVEEEQLRTLVNFGLDSLIKVRLIVASDSQSRKTIHLEQYDKLPGLDMATLALDEPRNQVIKRLFDLFFSLVFGVLVLSWFIPLIGLLIKLDSRGPVFFIQQRNGKGNIPFGCMKFRTMIVNKEADSKQASKDDPRITRIGKFLRKTSLDEIPQFLNVIIGNMSLIGPRPHPIKLNEQFSSKISNIMSRHYVKPGITGLAQCMGYRGETSKLIDMENRVRMDRYYIENWSFWLDIKIIFLTVVSLIRGSENAY
ncbi:MAG TPA: exopolysaccharide biosynthesis polyprenyl glycosylphosphotransferase [Cyclobacteriaceae bacterium]|nr:exopolysaccharide biosynthesis polyprenyl glycosylphosphotransferase [Cyclobacteriaceae bacterium]